MAGKNQTNKKDSSHTYKETAQQKQTEFILPKKYMTQ